MIKRKPIIHEVESSSGRWEAIFSRKKKAELLPNDNFQEGDFVNFIDLESENKIWVSAKITHVDRSCLSDLSLVSIETLNYMLPLLPPIDETPRFYTCKEGEVFLDSSELYKVDHENQSVVKEETFTGISSEGPIFLVIAEGTSLTFYRSDAIVVSPDKKLTISIYQLVQGWGIKVTDPIILDYFKKVKQKQEQFRKTPAIGLYYNGSEGVPIQFKNVGFFYENASRIIVNNGWTDTKISKDQLIGLFVYGQPKVFRVGDISEVIQTEHGWFVSFTASSALDVKEVNDFSVALKQVGLVGGYESLSLCELVTV